MNDYDEDDDWLADDEGNLTPEAARSLQNGDRSFVWEEVKEILTSICWVIALLVLLSVLCGARLPAAPAAPRPALSHNTSVTA